MSYMSADGCLYNKAGTELIVCPGAKESVNIKSGTKMIKSSSFNSCKLLTSVEIPNGTESIGEYAFYYCTSLQSVEIPESVTGIKEYAFGNCSSLQYIVGKKDSYAETYANENSIPFMVKPKSLTDDMIRVDSKQAEYTGSELEAKFTVCDGETPLVKGTDYKIISGGSATNVGNNKLIINGLGNYKGEVSATWSLQKATPTADDFDIPQNLTGVRGAALNTVNLPKGFAWNEPETVMNEIGSKQYTATYTPDDTKNYNKVTDLALSVTVKELTELAVSGRIKAWDKTENMILALYPSDMADKDIRKDMRGECNSATIVTEETEFGSYEEEAGKYARNFSFKRSLMDGDYKLAIYVTEDSGKSAYAVSVAEFTVKNGSVLFKDGAENINMQLRGDADKNGSIDFIDALCLKRYIAAWENYSFAGEFVSDINADGEVNLADLIILEHYIAGWSGVTL